MTVLQNARLSHSEIRGSKVICTYPRLVAAYHVLHRLWEPRHPPCALSYFLARFFVVSHLPPRILFGGTGPDGRRTRAGGRTKVEYTFSFLLLWLWNYCLLFAISSKKNWWSFLRSTFAFASSCQRSFPNTRPGWWRITDSNRWPPACKAGALAIWANPSVIWCNS